MIYRNKGRYKASYKTSFITPFSTSDNMCTKNMTVVIVIVIVIDIVILWYVLAYDFCHLITFDYGLTVLNFSRRFEFLFILLFVCTCTSNAKKQKMYKQSFNVCYKFFFFAFIRKLFKAEQKHFFLFYTFTTKTIWNILTLLSNSSRIFNKRHRETNENKTNEDIS